MAKARKARRRYRPSVEVLPKRLPSPRVEIDRALAWYVLWTSPQAEWRIVRKLSDAGLSTYVPVEAVELIRRGQRITQERPAISRYVFVGLHPACPEFGAVSGALEEWPGIPTMGRLLSTDNGPLKVPSGALQRLADGVTVWDIGQRLFAAGELAKAVSGPFQGLYVEIASASDQRVRALVALFGGRALVEFELGQLEAA